LADFTWTKPTVGGSNGTWGTELNVILDILLAHPGIKVVADATAKAAYVPLLGQIILQADTGKIYKCTNATGPVWAEVGVTDGIMTTQGDIIVQGASSPAKLAIGTAKQVPRVNAGATALEYAANTRGICFSINNVDLATTQSVAITAPCALTITGGKIEVGTAPTGAALICDVHKNGTTLWTTQGNRPTVVTNALITALTGDNNDLLYQSKLDYTKYVSVVYVDPEALTAACSAVRSGTGTSGEPYIVTVTLKHDGTVITATAADVKAAIEADANSNSTVICSNYSGNDGTGVVTALSATALSGGGVSAAITAPDVTSIAQGDRLLLMIDQIGSTVAGKDLSLTLYCEVA